MPSQIAGVEDMANLLLENATMNMSGTIGSKDLLRDNRTINCIKILYTTSTKPFAKN